MANFKGTFKCGHEGTVYYPGATRENKYKAENDFEVRICPQCFEKLKEEEIKQENEKNAILSKEKNLIELEGTEKQIAYATTLRIMGLEIIDKILPLLYQLKELKLKDECINSFIENGLGIKKDINDLISGYVSKKDFFMETVDAGKVIDFYNTNLKVEKTRVDVYVSKIKELIDEVKRLLKESPEEVEELLEK